MPPVFIPAADCLKVELVWNFQERICENVLHMTYLNDRTPENLLHVADNLARWQQTEWADIGSIHAGMEKVIVTDVTEEGGASVEWTTYDNLNGDVGGTAMPLNVTLCIGLVTGYSGRSKRGRSFLVGLPLEAIQSSSPSYVTVEYQLAVKARWEALKQKMEDLAFGGGMVVVSYREDHAWRDFALVTPVQSIVVNRRLDTMRKRLPT